MKLSAQDWQVALAVCIGSINHGQHMKITPISFIWISFLFISGCADNLPIIKSGTNFMCDGHTGYWKEWSLGTGGRQIQDKCEMAAEDYCAKQGKKYDLIDARYSNTQPYTESKAQVVFKCKSQGDEARDIKLAEAELLKSVNKSRKDCIEIYGFKENTTELNQCVLDLQKEKAADASAMLNAKIMGSSAQQMSDQMDRARGQAIMDSVRPRTCTTNLGVTTCF